MQKGRLAILLMALLLAVPGVKAQSNADVLRRMLHFGETHRALTPDTMETNVYTKYTINVVKRNAMLAAVPTMFYLLRDHKRYYFSEAYTRMEMKSGKQETHRYLHLSTVYHRHNTLPSMVKYLTPRVYDQKLFEDGILSPINFNNRKYYRYRMRRYNDGTSYINIRSKFRSTQLIRRGHVIVQDSTGQVLQFNFEGEYDMIHSVLNGTMHREGYNILFPDKCDVQAKLSFVGNKILCHYVSLYDQPFNLPDSIVESHDCALMDSIRPIPFSNEEKAIIAGNPYWFPSKEKKDTVSLSAAKDSIPQGSAQSGKKRRNWAKYVFWDVLGDNMLNKINANIGAEDKGQIKIGPIFNPFYFGYTKHKGVIYRFDIRGYYYFTPNNNITGRLKLGYSFKKNLLFYKIPVQWNFNRRRNGYVVMEFANGNRITNSRVLEDVKRYKTNDSIDWDAMNLQYFHDQWLHVGFNYDVIKNTLGVQTGFTKYRRSAVDKSGFKAAGRPAVYKSFAPFIQLQYRPLTDRVPLVITGEWEHGLKHFGGKIAYDRFEFDGQYVHYLPCMRNLQLRTGFGFYTHKGHDDYFLDYENFHEDYISLGWEDKWSGEFELLNSNWYNASSYYVRANATYESPFLLLSHCPLIGQVIEEERVYLSALAVSRMFPYIEVGYGFTNRVFSMGIFTGFSPHNFEGVGLKFGFELFNNY